MRFLFVLVLCYPAFTYAGEGGEPLINESWVEFMDRPNMTNAETLVGDLSNTVKNCDWGAPDNLVAAPPGIHDALFNEIETGNRASLKIGFFVHRCLDGGDLGDFKRSAGQFFDQDPDGFIDSAQDASISSDLFASILTALPLTLVDKIDDKISAIRLRIELLSRVDLPQDAAFKNHGFTALRDYEDLLLSVR